MYACMRILVYIFVHRKFWKDALVQSELLYFAEKGKWGGGERGRGRMRGREKGGGREKEGEGAREGTWELGLHTRR